MDQSTDLLFQLFTKLFTFINSNPEMLLTLITIWLTDWAKKTFKAKKRLDRSWPLLVSIGVSFLYMLVKNVPLIVEPPEGFVFVLKAIWQYTINLVWLGLKVTAWAFLVHNLIVKNWIKKAS